MEITILKLSYFIILVYTKIIKDRYLNPYIDYIINS